MGIVQCSKHGRSGICDVSEAVRVAVYQNVPIGVSRFELKFDDEDLGEIRFVWSVDDETRAGLLRDRVVIDDVICARTEAELQQLLHAMSVTCDKCFEEYCVRYSLESAL